jgi:hypothetical protein
MRPIEETADRSRNGLDGRGEAGFTAGSPVFTGPGGSAVFTGSGGWAAFGASRGSAAGSGASAAGGRAPGQTSGWNFMPTFSQISATMAATVRGSEKS